MTNKIISIIHYSISLVFVLAITITALVLLIPNPEVGSIFSDPLPWTAIIFGCSTLIIAIVYLVTTVSLSRGEKPLRILLPLLISSLFTAMVISVIQYGFQSINNNIFDSDLTKQIIKYTLMALLAIVSLVIIVISQGYTTKFLLISMSANRLTEWELTNFFNMFFTKSNIKHKGTLSHLYSKEFEMIIKFIPEEEVERTINIEGDIVSSEVSQIKNELKPGQKGAIVFLSNKLPNVIGKQEDILVIKNTDLFKTFKNLSKEIK